MPTVITNIDCIEFRYPIKGVRRERRNWADLYVADPNEAFDKHAWGIRIETDDGAVGEYLTSRGTTGIAEVREVADLLIGKDPLERERAWVELKRRTRQYDCNGIGVIDIALWDVAGKYYGAPIHELLGSYRTHLPCYASTGHGQSKGALDSPERYADFAEECLALGYPAFKIHGFDYSEEKSLHKLAIEIIHAVGGRVGDEMDLMMDGSCKYETWAQALEVGRACDQYDFFWYEDPYRDAGTSQHGHRKLRQMIDTSILQGEMVPRLEQLTDFIATESTDFIRADPDFNGGITGAMKLAHVAEGFGVDIEYHAPSPPVRHCMAATRNSNYYEIAHAHPDYPNPYDIPAYDDAYSDRYDDVNADGTVPVPDGPGLGVDIDWSFVEENAVQEFTFG